MVSLDSQQLQQIATVTYRDNDKWKRIDGWMDLRLGRKFLKVCQNQTMQTSAVTTERYIEYLLYLSQWYSWSF